VYIILFYNPGTGSQALQQKNDEYRQAIKAQILDKNPAFYYTEVDATHQEYAGFVNNVIKVNTEELKMNKRERGFKYFLILPQVS
jgi:hypothetical protein